MTISLSDTGKRYNRDWIFRHLTYQFEAGKSYAITGPNGSGKSTLLQVLSGNTMTNEGKIEWQLNGKVLSEENVHKHISICAPFLEVIEEMTLNEFLHFHYSFKPFISGISIADIVGITGLDNAVNKQIRYYSSGMKQRVKMAQCIFSDTSVVLLDEPCTNLDAAGIELYHILIKNYCTNRIVVVSSNDEEEFSFCQSVINISDFKRP
jgi:ABC-type multidrug transport system ATPase subunit